MPRSLGRRSLLKRFLPETAEHISLDVHRSAGIALPRRRRPPGAASEAEFLEVCTRCGDCVRACPELSIFTLADSVGIGAGTPVLVPDERACRLCEGFPCASACETGALVTPEERTWRLGTVTLVTERCLPFRGPECGACARLCPTESPALTLTLGRPDVDPALCVGCGLCIEACPTSPKALELVPLDAEVTQRATDVD